MTFPRPADDQLKKDWDDLQKKLEWGVPPDIFDYLLSRPIFKTTKDKFGHSITLSARVPEAVYRRIQVFREMRGSPYQVMSDVVRDAIFLGILVLNARFGLDLVWRIPWDLADEAQEERDIQKAVDHLADELNHVSEESRKRTIKQICDELDGRPERQRKIFFKSIQKSPFLSMLMKEAGIELPPDQP